MLLGLSATAMAGALPFQEWKQQREHEAQLLLDKARQIDKNIPSETTKKVSHVSHHPNDESALGDAGGRFRHMSEKDNSLAQAEHNLQMAHELSITDYFILYLRQQPEVVFHEGVDRLSKTEMSELLVSFRNHLATAEGNESPSTLAPEPPKANPPGL
jgi:hypothetical protein